MWTCESCRNYFHYEQMANDLRFGYVDSEEVKQGMSAYMAFQTEQGVGPLCDDCAIAYIKGENIGEQRI